MKKIKQVCFFSITGSITTLLTLLMLAIPLPNIAHANISAGTSTPYLTEHARGWFWYERTPIPQKKKKAEKKKTEEVFSFPPKTMVDARKQIDALKTRAIMQPTEKNLVAYIRLQNWVSDKSEQFANVWQKVIWQHPELNYAIAHPTNAQALEIQADEKDVYNHRRIAQLGKHYGLFFVFESTCPYCHREAPMLKTFSQSYGISIIPISRDGIGLPDYPNPRPDTGISGLLHVHAVPALFLVNPKQRQVIPLAYGLISESELIRRIIALTSRSARPQTGYQSLYNRGHFQ